ncbi:F(420)H(2) dehydrogenase subunit B [Methanosalsum natronophilum]|uniref:NADH-quinone oxidoreductase subunit B n=1 Tax=Methanosalsum natronophilum TaxID=768733 RepID=A0A424YNQ1_9EURY|nr:F(420)H(2) dehydrogenase subunit B [Methanosalsum natronophilum]MCS3923202.1 NADH-quinone oxidoreductase subunit B [Methanosalsum natronophilum]RQD80635.1 MAG: NADH-quinone oxidoreductase subunit B [Methanosalsum natronophilum]
MGEVNQKEKKVDLRKAQSPESIPGVMTTTSNAISDFLKKTPAQDFINWGRKNSLWFMTQPMGCCGVEMIATGCAHYDTDRFGIIPRNSPRQADVMVISGYVTKKYLPALKKLWDQMASPKWILAMGDCSISGGPFYQSYSTVQNIEEIFPIDVYIPGCPPRPEALLEGFIQLQKKIEAKKDKGSEY